MAEKRQLRAQVSSEGAFTSVPGLYFSAPEGLQHAVKLEVGTTLVEDRSDGKEPALRYETSVWTDRALLDFDAVDPDAVELGRVERDCEILKDAIKNHPEILQQAMAAVTGGAHDQDKIKAATEALASIGLTEEHVHANGGGLIGLAILVGVALLCAGCYGCAHCSGSTPPPAVPHAPKPVHS